MHDAGGLVSRGSEIQGVWCPGDRKSSGFGVEGVWGPEGLGSRGFGVQGVGMVITSRRDAAHTARKLVIY